MCQSGVPGDGDDSDTCCLCAAQVGCPAASRGGPTTTCPKGRKEYGAFHVAIAEDVAPYAYLLHIPPPQSVPHRPARSHRRASFASAGAWLIGPRTRRCFAVDVYTRRVQQRNAQQVPLTVVSFVRLQQ